MTLLEVETKEQGKCLIDIDKITWLHYESESVVFGSEVAMYLEKESFSKLTQLLRKEHKVLI